MIAWSCVHRARVPGCALTRCPWLLLQRACPVIRALSATNVLLIMDACRTTTGEAQPFPTATAVLLATPVRSVPLHSSLKSKSCLQPCTVVCDRSWQRRCSTYRHDLCKVHHILGLLPPQQRRLQGVQGGLPIRLLRASEPTTATGIGCRQSAELQACDRQVETACLCTPCRRIGGCRKCGVKDIDCLLGGQVENCGAGRVWSNATKSCGEHFSCCQLPCH
jgi:hypothetical protein